MRQASFPWMPDQGDGTYLNPVLFADYSDPDVIRHGEDFYLVSSSFQCTPGLPILHSKDLVNWTILNHALKNLPDDRYSQVQPGCGVWAPSIRYHAGKFWIFYPTPDEGIFMITAEDPAGEWTLPHCVQAGRGMIDPCPLWDDDGQAYLVFAYAKSRAGINDRLVIAAMAPDGSRLLGKPHLVFMDSERHPTIEGPKFLKKDGWYYIFAPAGGVGTGWQVVLRSCSIFGPYEDKIALEQGSSPVNGPHQGALVDLPNGDWWFLHFQEKQPYGRIVHLQPVRWEDGWPCIGVDQDGNGIGEPVQRSKKPDVGQDYPVIIPQTSDTFTNPRLGLQWQWQANHSDAWASLSARVGWLRLYAQPAASLPQSPAQLLQKFPAPAFRVETLLEFRPIQAGEMAGLMIAGRSWAALYLEKIEKGFRLVYQADGVDQASTAIEKAAIRLQLSVNEAGLCQFAYAIPSNTLPGSQIQTLGSSFKAREGHWIGAKVGLFALTPPHDGESGCADYQYFVFHPIESEFNP